MTSPAIGADPSLIASIDEFLSGRFGLAASAEFDRTGEISAESWTAIEELGLTLVGIDEADGGSGGGLADALAMMMGAGRYAVALPLAETQLAAWLLSSAGRPVPTGALSVAPGDARDTATVSGDAASGRLHQVPWARHVDLVVALVTDADGRPYVVSFDPANNISHHGQDLAGQPRDTVDIPADAVVEPAPVTAADLFWRGALLRAGQMSGAMAGVAALSQQYASERVQFGRPINAFQAVQQHLVTIAQCAELSSMSVWRAGSSLERRPASFEVCAAKLTANESARVCARAAHQAHGAIGVTREYPLHLLTRRLNTWRQDFGGEAQLADVLGAAVSAAPSFARVLADSDNEIEVQCPTT